MAAYDTIIVGMGAAGCIAASVLCKAGKRVLALEAQNRVGGRVNTVPLGDGVVELGAEWVHGDNNSRGYELAIQNNIPIQSHDDPHQGLGNEREHDGGEVHNVSIVPQGDLLKAFRSDGSALDTSIVDELVKFSMEAVDDPPEEPEPVGQYLKRRLVEYINAKHPELQQHEFVDQFLYFMALVVRNYEGAHSWNDVTTENNYENLGGNLHLSWHKYGYKTLFELLLNTYKGGPGYPKLNLQLGKAVNKISYPQSPKQDVEVICEDGAIYRAKNVIVTVSLGVLKERYTTMFFPPLPYAKAAAIEQISIGIVDKIVLLFPDVWWPKENIFFAFIWREEDRAEIPDEYSWVTTIFGASVPEGSNKALTMWLSGTEAKVVERLPEAVVRRKAIEVIKRFMGRNLNVPEPISILRSSWYSNPYTRGSYTYDNVHMPQHPDARAALAQPLVDSSGAPRVLFAGEATDSIHFSTVHGALDTGHREASRLLPYSKL